MAGPSYVVLFIAPNTLRANARVASGDATQRYWTRRQSSVKMNS